MDKYNLQRFVDAQENAYEHALQEMRRGFKWGHWIWYIFPQLKGLGHSYNSDFYGISGLDEANAYLAHPILGRRLREITEVLLTHSDKSAEAIFTKIDAKKVRSSMTLFDAVCPNDVFEQVLCQFYDGRKDRRSLSILEVEKSLPDDMIETTHNIEGGMTRIS